MDVQARFINYVKIHTTSDDSGTATPSTSRQFDLARLLEREMLELGLNDVIVDDKCYVYGKIPATPGYEARVRLGLIAHLDTSPETSGENVRPQLIKNYDGQDLRLGSSDQFLRIRDFPDLPKLKGQTLITTDGTTLLGADDKAGLAEILTACQQLLAGGQPHGAISVAFTPDEEIGHGAQFFDFARFDCDYAYTIDGGRDGEIEYQNFNGADAIFEITGTNVHPGTAKHIMVNAALVACEINAMLPGADIPALTENYEGFYHLQKMSGSVESARLDYIIRDHDRSRFEARKALVQHIAKTLNEKYGPTTVKLTLADRYYNMEENILPHFHLIENAILANRHVGIEPIVQPIRGGTDGAWLSARGLPCPNLATGGYGFHGPYEHITVESLERSVAVILELIRLYSSIDSPSAKGKYDSNSAHP